MHITTDGLSSLTTCLSGLCISLRSVFSMLSWNWQYGDVNLKINQNLIQYIILISWTQGIICDNNLRMLNWNKKWNLVELNVTLEEAGIRNTIAVWIGIEFLNAHHLCSFILNNVILKVSSLRGTCFNTFVSIVSYTFVAL